MMDILFSDLFRYEVISQEEHDLAVDRWNPINNIKPFYEPGSSSPIITVKSVVPAPSLPLDFKDMCENMQKYILTTNIPPTAKELFFYHAKVFREPCYLKGELKGLIQSVGRQLPGATTIEFFNMRAVVKNECWRYPYTIFGRNRDNTGRLVPSFVGPPGVKYYVCRYRGGSWNTDELTSDDFDEW